MATGNGAGYFDTVASCRGVHPIWGNEAEIFIIPILGGEILNFREEILNFSGELNVLSSWGAGPD